MGVQRKIGYINDNGRFILTSEEADRLFEDYSLLETKAIEWIERETRLYRENLQRQKEYDPDFNKYLKDELKAELNIGRADNGQVWVRGGVLPLMNYYREKATSSDSATAYNSAVMYHYNKKRLEVIREFMSTTGQPPQQSDTESQHERPTEKRKAGRPVGNLKDRLMTADKEATLKELHNVMEGKTGKAAALVIRVCIELGIMSQPTFKEVETFCGGIGSIGSNSVFNDYLNGRNNRTFTEIEYNGMRTALSHLKGQKQ